MGKRDYRHREPKKTRKSDKKVAAVTILPSTPPAEVVKKGKSGEETEG